MLVLGFPVAVGLAFWAMLRQPFDPVRLPVKSLVPLAAVLPAAVLLPPGSLRAAAAAAFSVSAILAATAACVSVFGGSLEPEILVPLLGFTSPPVLPLAAVLALLTA